MPLFGGSTIDYIARSKSYIIYGSTVHYYPWSRVISLVILHSWYIVRATAGNAACMADFAYRCKLDTEPLQHMYICRLIILCKNNASCIPP